jgi:hypothetical protein
VRKGVALLSLSQRFIGHETVMAHENAVTSPFFSRLPEKVNVAKCGFSNQDISNSFAAPVYLNFQPERLAGYSRGHKLIRRY